MKQLIEIEFEDHGQDFLSWKLEMHTDVNMGKVIESDMQNNIWTEFYVLNKPEVGGHLRISKSPDDDVITIKYLITKVTVLQDEVN